jgi:hypothetical protein
MAEEAEKKPSFGAALDLITSTLKGFDEPAQRTMISTVCALLNLKVDVGAQAPAAAVDTISTPAKAAAAPMGNLKLSGLDIRTLKEQKKPSSAQQMAAVVAFYLQEIAPEVERKDTIKTDDLEAYFKQARYELPKKLEQVLDKGKRAGYFESPSRGTFKLTRVGYNLVAHKMPAEG